jgi:pseudouridine-5'-monophosphatase
MRGKPEPDIFLAAARKLLGRDVGPADADATPTQLAERRKGLVFEDSIPGMQAGKCAGMSAAVQIALLVLVSRLFGLPHIVVWVPDANLLGVEYSGEEKADQTLKSLDDFVPEQWGLPPYTQ